MEQQQPTSLTPKAEATRQRILDTALTLFATKATDAPKGPQAHHLAIILYGANLALGLFWLQDRSPDNKPTYELLAFTRDMIALLRPLLGLPPLSKAVARLAGIIEPVMGVVE